MRIFHSAFFILIVCVFFINESCDAQFKSGIESEVKTRISFSDRNDSTVKNTDIKPTFRMKKEPWRAVAYSAVIPGAGQFYTESYWKIPVILGLGSYFVYGIINNNNQYLDYKDQYQNSQTAQNPDGDPQLLNLREFYRDQRDNFYIYSAILYLVNLIDAYVDAQLYDFNVTDKIKFGILKNNNLLGIDLNF